MSHEEFDHTSLLRYLSDKWNLHPLTERVASAKSIATAMPFGDQPRADTPTSLPVPTELPAVMRERMLAAESGEELNSQQKALIAFSEYLEQHIQEPVGKPLRAAAMMAGPPSQVATAKERVNLFLAQQKAKARLP